MLGKLFYVLRLLNKYDVIESVNSRISNSNPEYKKAFLVSLTISFAAYSFFIFNMTYVGDDLSLLTGTQLVNYLVSHGRYYLFVTHSFLYLGQILPGLEETLGIITLIMAGFYISRLWNVTDWKQIVIVQVFVTIFPSQVLLFNFNNAPLPISLGILCGVLGLIYIQKQFRLRNFLIALALFTVPFGTYQTTLFSLLVIIMGQAAIFIYEEEKISFKKIYQFSLIRIIPPLICLGTCHIVWNKLMIPILIKIHMTALELSKIETGGRNIQDIGLPRDIESWSHRFRQIINYPFDLYKDLFPHLIVPLCFISAICIFVGLIQRHKSYSIVLRFIAIATIFILAAWVIASPILFVKSFPTLPTRSSAGLAIVLLIPIIIAMRQKSIFVRNIHYALCSLFIIAMITFAINYGLRISIQNRADFLEASRIVGKIEELPYSEDIFSGKVPVLYVTNPKPINFTTLNGKMNFLTSRMNQLNLHPSSVVNIFKFIKPNSKMDINRTRGLPDKVTEYNNAPDDLIKMIQDKNEWPEKDSVFMADGKCVILMKSALPNLSFFRDRFDKSKFSELKIDHTNFIENTYGFSVALNKEPIIKDNVIELESTFVYPSFSIKRFVRTNSQPAVIKVSIEVPQKTFLRVSYQTTAEPRYHKDRMIGMFVAKGHNDVYVSIKDADFNGQLKIFPGITEGVYKIKEIIVKSGW
jgi:hypothetical protein